MVGGIPKLLGDTEMHPLTQSLLPIELNLKVKRQYYDFVIFSLFNQGIDHEGKSLDNGGKNGSKCILVYTGFENSKS